MVRLGQTDRPSRIAAWLCSFVHMACCFMVCTNFVMNKSCVRKGCYLG